MKRLWFVLGVLFVCLRASFAFGADLFHDSFSTTSALDTIYTTAHVNPTNGWVELPSEPQANVVAALSNGSDIASDLVVTQDSGVEWYTFDQAAHQYVHVTPWSYAATHPLGVSVVEESKTAYVFGRNSDGSQYVNQVVRDPSGAIDNPIMAVTNLHNVVSVTAIDDLTFGSVDETGHVTVYQYDPVTHHPVLDADHSFSTGLHSVKSVTHIPNTWNFVVTTQTGSVEFAYDQLSGTYQSNTAKQVVTGNDVIVGTTNTTGDLIALLTPDQTTVYTSMYDQQSGGMNTVSLLYTGGDVGKAVAVQLPSRTSTVLATSEGTINTYRFDSTSGHMVLDPSLQIGGLSFDHTYVSPALYQSLPIPMTPSNMFRVMPTEGNDSDTAISYTLSADGGGSFTPVLANQWVHLPTGSTNPPLGSNIATGPLLVRSTLSSSDSRHTPRLTDMLVQGYLDVTPPTTPEKPTAVLSTPHQLIVSWSPCLDPILSPSTGASGVDDYLLRYSSDGTTWTSWVSVGSATTYPISIPDSYEATMQVEVEAIDLAGNLSSPSPTESFYVNTKPLGAHDLLVTQVIAPSDMQPSPPTSVPVRVKAGGEVLYSVATTGAAQTVHVRYSDGLEQDLIPVHDPTTATDSNVFMGYYYPSSNNMIPLTTPDGTVISISQLTVSAPGKADISLSTDLLQIAGTLGNGGADFLPPHISR